MDNKTCRSCRWAFMNKTSDHQFVLVCWPGGIEEFEKPARVVCCLYQREAGADEEIE